MVYVCTSLCGFILPCMHIWLSSLLVIFIFIFGDKKISCFPWSLPIWVVLRASLYQSMQLPTEPIISLFYRHILDISEMWLGK